MSECARRQNRESQNRESQNREKRNTFETTSAERTRPGRCGAAAATIRNPGTLPQVLGALDLGTNNCRLLIAQPLRRGFRVLDSFSRVVRLGEGLSLSGYLSEAAIERTLKALKVCNGKIRRLGVTRVRCVATAACRRALNFADFRNRVESEFGLELEVISCFEETRLAVYGCAPLFDPCTETALVFDIGGGSTEICWVALPRNRWNGVSVLSDKEPGTEAGAPVAAFAEQALSEPALLAWKSLPLGVTTLAERYGGGDISRACYERMVAEVIEGLQPFEAENGIFGLLREQRVQVLGTSGTVTTLVGIEKGLARYDRRRVDGAFLSRTSIEVLNRRIAAMSYRERVAHPCIGYQRADLVVAGCAILDALCRTWPADRLRVADRGLREGIIFTLMRGASLTGNALDAVP